MAKRILVVDDEEDLVILLKAILQREGYEVIGAYNGKECLNALKRFTPDLIIMDIMMPGMTGVEATEKIRKDPSKKNLK